MSKKVNGVRHLKKDRFLKAFETCGNITQAAEIAKIDRTSHYIWMNADPAYPERFEAAQEAAIQSLEKIAWERAKNKSDLLMIFMLKSLRPERYRDRTEVEHTGELKLTFAEQTVSRLHEIEKSERLQTINGEKNRLKAFSKN
jgi:hypothetical protein